VLIDLFQGGFLSTPMFVTPTLGFASNLSHTIIREAQEDDDRSQNTNDSDTTDLELTDEELALLGAPWAKEGILARKHYWESTGKKARNRNWQDVFVVISKGELSMFTFGDMAGGGSGVVGGGNWLVSGASQNNVAFWLILFLGKRCSSRNRESCTFTSSCAPSTWL
jgi:hypothetical protein